MLPIRFHSFTNFRRFAFICFYIPVVLVVASSPPPYLEGLSENEWSTLSSRDITDNISTSVTNEQSFITNPNDTPGQGHKQPKTTAYRQKCEEGNMYAYLNTCITECNGTFSEEKESFVKKNKFNFKLIILQKDEYNVTENDSLLTDIDGNSQFSTGYFTKGNKGEIYLCLPMPEVFLKCVYWKIKPGEFERRGRQMWVPGHDKNYTVTEHVYSKKTKDLITCIIKPTQFKSIRDISILVLWFISVIFLGITIVLALIFPDLHLKGNKLLLCNFAMLLIAYSMLCIKYLTKNKNDTACLVFAHLQQYAFLSAFCWINAQALNVFLHFTRLRLLQRCDSKGENNKQFLMFAIHGWGTPFFITIFTVIMEAADVKNFNPRLVDQCWFKHRDRDLAFLYFYGPIALILIINLLLFLYTIYKLCSMKKRQNHMKKGIQKQLLTVYMKLVVVMGLCWIMEVISAGAGGDDKIWYFTDMINALQGLFIFLVYVCKPSFIKKILKIRPESTRTRGGETTASTTNNSTLGRDISLVSQNDRL